MKMLFAVLATIVLAATVALAQASSFTFLTGAAPCAVGYPSCNVPVDGGGTIFFRYTSGYYGNTINVWINTPTFSDAVGPVPATLVQTANAGTCSIDNRFDLTIPQVEVTDAAGTKYTLSGVQHFSQYYSRGGGGRGGGGAGCHYNDLGNGSFTLTPIVP